MKAIKYDHDYYYNQLKESLLNLMRENNWQSGRIANKFLEDIPQNSFIPFDLIRDYESLFNAVWDIIDHNTFRPTTVTYCFEIVGQYQGFEKRIKKELHHFAQSSLLKREQEIIFNNEMQRLS